MSTTFSSASYFVWDTNKTAQGPLDLASVVSKVKSGAIAAGTWIFVSRGGLWERAASVPELRAFFHVRRPNLKLPAGAHHHTRGVDANTLRRNRLLCDFTDEELERFAQYAEVERLPQAAVVVKQGDRSTSIYLILEGELSVQLNLGDGETELATLGASDFFGDLALFDQGPRSADVVANRSCLLLKITADAFKKMSAEAPDLALPFLHAIGRTLTARIRASNKHQGEAVKMAKALF